MLDLGGVRDRAELSRRLAVTAAFLIVYRLGLQIPLPGIDPQALSQISGTALQRVSIFALGITPFITVLILTELVKVLMPRLRRWEHSDPRNRDKLNRMVVGLSLLATAAQAAGLVLALEDVSGLVEAPGTAFRLVSIATLVASTAFVIWLADQITRHGIGSGAWLILVTPWIADIPFRVAMLALHQAQGNFPVWGVLLGCALIVPVLAAAVGLLRAGGTLLETGATCLWSVLLAGTAWPWLMLVIAALLSTGSLGTGAWFGPSDPIALLAFAGLVALFVHLHMRSQRLAGTPQLPAIPSSLLAGALAAIVLADMVLAAQLAGLLPLGGHLLIIAVVALSVLGRWWRPPFEAKGQTE